MADHWEDYEHSSAKFYVKNNASGFTPVHYEELGLASPRHAGVPWQQHKGYKRRPQQDEAGLSEFSYEFKYSSASFYYKQDN